MSEEALGQVLSPLRKSQYAIISLVVQAMVNLGQAASAIHITDFRQLIF